MRLRALALAALLTLTATLAACSGWTVTLAGRGHVFGVGHHPRTRVEAGPILTHRF